MKREPASPPIPLARLLAMAYRQLIDDLHDRLAREGYTDVRPEFGYVLLAARKKGSHVTRAHRPLPPRAEGASDIERDPLWSAEATPPLSHSLPSGPRARLLRQALLARRPKRANLYRESRLAALLPRRTKPADPQIECLLRTAATLAGE